MTLSSNKDDGPLFTLNDSSFFGSKESGRSLASKRERLAASISGFLSGGGKKMVGFFLVDSLGGGIDAD
jgi:hypothetical protein